MKQVFLHKPIVDIYGGYAILDSLSQQTRSGKEWLAQNFFNIITCYDKEYSNIISEFINLDQLFFNSNIYYQPERQTVFPLQTYSYPREQFTRSNFLKFVKKQIDSNYLITCFVNLKYLPIFEKKHHYLHDIFIVGYSDKYFLLKGYRNGEKFKFIEVPIEEFVNAFFLIKECAKIDPTFKLRHDISRVSVVRYYEDFKFTFCTKKLKNDVDFYLTQRNRPYFFEMQIIKGQFEKSGTLFGNQIYIALKKNLEFCLKNSKDLNVLQYYFLVNHKNMLVFKMKFLENNEYIKEKKYSEESQYIESKCKKLMLMSIKFNLKSDRIAKEIIVKAMIKEINFIKKLEDDLLRKLYNTL